MKKDMNPKIKEQANASHLVYLITKIPIRAQ